jgi:site-specific recombinase XerD
MMIDENPVINIESPKQKESLPKFLSIEESLLLLEAVKNDRESKSRIRDYAIITLFLNCGMRVSELVGINLNDVDREFRSVTVTGKGNKERLVYLNSACQSAVQDYLSVRPNDDVNANDRNALFISRNKRRISPKTVQHIVKTYLDKAGLGDQGFSTHKLRHTAATLMYQHGQVDIRVLKDILGHSNLGTTQIYTHVSDQQIKNAVDMNPLSNVKNKK